MTFAIPTRHLACLFLLVTTWDTAYSDEDKCEPCTGGQVNPDLSFDGIACASWLEVAASAPADSAQCAFDRMVGVWFCGCPVPETIEETCTVCPDGSTGFNTEKKFPDSSITCQDVATIAAIDGEKTCNELHQMSAFCECPVSSENCKMCPNGETPAFLDRIFLTTGDTCRHVKEMLDISPNSDCGKYVSDLNVDVPSFCGCPDAEPPRTCSLCVEGTQLADRDHEISFVPGSTCGDFDDYVAFISDDTMCDYMHEAISMECCEGADPTLEISEEMECNFCPDGNNVALPGRELVGANLTCGDLASREGGNGDCTVLYETELDMVIDTGIYCGCPELTSTGICNLCPEGQELLYPNRPINTGVEGVDATCADYAALADATYEDSFCAVVQNVAEINYCCGYHEDANSTTSSNSTTDFKESSDFCDLCIDGSQVQHTDKFFLGTSVTCEQYYDDMHALPKGDECDAIFGDFVHTFNPQIYCGCPGIESTDECSLCPEGSFVADPNIWISDIFTTCGQMADLAAATSNEDFCSSLQQVGNYYCCFSPGSPVEEARNGGTRHLRSFERTLAVSAPSSVQQRQFHFAAMKALDSIKHIASELAGMQNPPIEY